MAPPVDINLFVHNGAATVGAAIESVRAQTWTNWRLTLIDDGSTDDTSAILHQCAAGDDRIQIKRNRCNVGAVGAFQRGLWFGDADYVMLKSADDLIAPEFVARLMAVLQAYPDCVMAHAAGLSFHEGGVLDFIYPESHWLHAVDRDPVARAASVMRRYTSSPSFWGVYRRAAVDRLAPIAYRPGWDHVLLAELALYGEIRHDPGVMYWRRGTGRPIADLARAATQEAARGLGLSTPLAGSLWRVPCIATAFAHIENFTIAPFALDVRRRLIAEATSIFAARWRPHMEREWQTARRFVLHQAATTEPPDGPLVVANLTMLITAAALMLPELDYGPEYAALNHLQDYAVACRV